jgi:hypothetical protein
MTRHGASERVSSWLKDFAIPAGAVLVTATGAWMRMEYVAGDHSRRMADMEARLSRVFDIGPDGISDPFLHGAHDLYLQHAIDGRYVTVEQWREWHRSFHQLNPQLIQPRTDAETVPR